jgi:NAD-dependent deacetylase
MDVMAQAKTVLGTAKKIVVLTGAGISVESGIPAFRTDADALWSKFDMGKATLSYFLHNPEGFWKALGPLAGKFMGAKPNAAHAALAGLEQTGRLKALITQNIDGLHQEAGSKRVIEFHGNARRLVCLKCGKAYSVAEILAVHDPENETIVPACECGQILKPDATLFGESIPPDALKAALKAVRGMVDAMLIVGTSGSIQPANQLPQIAKERGVKVIEVNPSPTPYTQHRITDIFVKGAAGMVLPQILGGKLCQ